MFIYCIEVKGLKYFGFDTKLPHKSNRWKNHCAAALSNKGKKYKVHKAMEEAGIDNCNYSIIEEEFTTIVDLALAEIYYIKKYDTKNNGLNSTYGGDGLGRHLHTMSDEDIQKIKDALSKKMSSYNNEVKWKDTTPEQRKIIIASRGIYSPDIIKKRAASLKVTYDACPDLRAQKGIDIKQWQAKNRDKLIEQNKANSLAAAAVNSKPIKVTTPDGKEIMYISKTEFVKDHGHIINNIIKKTSEGSDHNGWKGWHI
jgi:hypothetical protein